MTHATHLPIRAATMTLLLVTALTFSAGTALAVEAGATGREVNGHTFMRDRLSPQCA
jgi:hypothetical protein